MPGLAASVDRGDARFSGAPADARLAEMAAGGDRGAFETLIAAHYDFIFRVAFKWCGSKEDAEDITQDVVIKLARIVGTYDGRAAFSSWLYRVVINAVRDMQRQQSRRRRQRVELEETSLSHAPADQEQNALTGELWAAVRALPERQRDAMLLVYGEDKSHGEVATILECKESTVSWHVHEAKKTLKKLL